MPIEVLHEDKRLLIVSKPARMMTVPAPSGRAQNKGKPLVQHLQDDGHTVFAVHRLDYETSGVVVFAKDAEMREELMELFKQKAVKKTYLALVQGHLEKGAGRIDLPIKDLGASARVDRSGSPALTIWERVSFLGPTTLVRVQPETGRHNQIRIHFAAMKHPLVGERKFAMGKDDPVGHKRVMLHAQAIKFRPPHLDHDLQVKAAAPDDFEGCLAKAEVTRPQRPARTPQPRRR